MFTHSLFSNTKWNKATFRVLLDKTRRLFILLVFLFSIFGNAPVSVKAADLVTFTGGELLGKPTDDSITINIIPATTIEYHYQYGLAPGANTWQTGNFTATGGR